MIMCMQLLHSVFAIKVMIQKIFEKEIWYRMLASRVFWGVTWFCMSWTWAWCSRSRLSASFSPISLNLSCARWERARGGAREGARVKVLCGSVSICMCVCVRVCLVSQQEPTTACLSLGTGRAHRLTCFCVCVSVCLYALLICRSGRIILQKCFNFIQEKKGSCSKHLPVCRSGRIILQKGFNK